MVHAMGQMWEKMLGLALDNKLVQLWDPSMVSPTVDERVLRLALLKVISLDYSLAAV